MEIDYFRYKDTVILKGFYDQILGVSYDNRLIYDYDAIIRCIAERDSVEEIEARNSINPIIESIEFSKKPFFLSVSNLKHRFYGVYCVSKLNGFEDCKIGNAYFGYMIYDLKKVIDKIMETEGLSEEEAQIFFENNIVETEPNRIKARIPVFLSPIAGTKYESILSSLRRGSPSNI